MLLVVDSNIILAALIAARRTLKLVHSKELELVSPELLSEEVERNLPDIAARSVFSELELKVMFAELMLRTKLFPSSEFKDFLDEAVRVCPRPEDVSFFALALKLNCPLWSNEKALKQQGKVEVFTTSEVANLIE